MCFINIRAYNIELARITVVVKQVKYKLFGGYNRVQQYGRNTW